MNIVYYTYLIGWSKHNKWYYGVRYSKYSNPNELWITYFTSSNIVKSFRLKFGEPDVIQIRKTFNSPNKAKMWEHKVLTKMNIKQNMWLNQCANLFPFNTQNKDYMKTQSYRDKISKANKGKAPWNKGKTNSYSIGRKFYNNGKIQKMLFENDVPLGWVKGRLNKAWNTGKPHSKETRIRISESQLGKARKPHSEETKQKMRDTWRLKREGA